MRGSVHAGLGSARSDKGPLAMKSNATTTAVIPGLAAGVIYFVIALATGASAVASIIGGIVVAAIAVAIGFIFRAVYKRRAAGHRD
jgi:hypothetical protein